MQTSFDVCNHATIVLYAKDGLLRWYRQHYRRKRRGREECRRLPEIRSEIKIAGFPCSLAISMIVCVLIAASALSNADWMNYEQFSTSASRDGRSSDARRAAKARLVFHLLRFHGCAPEGSARDLTERIICVAQRTGGLDCECRISH